MTDALEIEFFVACPVEHAFDVWTDRTDMWWPRDHTRSGRPDCNVTIEPRVGGRLFERTLDGDELEWGQVTIWDPPRRLGYLWHIYGEPHEATKVEMTFVPDGNATRIKVVHTGWVRLGDKGKQLRERNRHGWENLFRAFERAAIR